MIRRCWFPIEYIAMAAERSPYSATATPDPLPSTPATPSSWLDQQLRSWEQHPRKGWLWSGVVLLLTICIAFIWGVANIGLVDETEPLFAEAARQMLVRDDWVTPYFNEATRFDKPPLIYWLMAISYQLFGVNEWSVRFPSVLSASVLTGLVWLVLQRYGASALFRRAKLGDDDAPASHPKRHIRWLAATLGAALTAFNLETIVWGRIGVSDMLLSGCFGSALLTFFMAYAAPSPNSPSPTTAGTNRATQGRPTGVEVEPPQQSLGEWVWGFNLKDRWYLVSYIFIALAILAKGPVGIVLPGAIVVAFTLYTGQFWQTIIEMKPWRGIPLIAALTVPWYVLVIQANGEAYTRSFFGYHNFDRFTKAVNNHAAPWYFYFLIVLVGFAPWSLYLPAAIQRLKLWRRQRWVNQPRSTHLGIFACTWFMAVFVFFTIAATKLPSYVLPLMPAAAILVALLFSEEMAQPRMKPQMIGRSPRASATLLEASAQAPVEQASPQPVRRKRRRPKDLWLTGWVNLVFTLVIGGAIAASPLWLKLIEDPAMPDFPEALGESGLLIYGAVLCGEAAIALFILLRRRQYRWLWAVNLLGFVALFLFTLMPTLTLMDFHRQAPLRQAAAVIQQQHQPNEEIIMVGFEKPTVVFYGQQPMLFFRRARSTLRYLETYSLQISEPETVLILTYPDELEPLGLSLDADGVELLEKDGAYQLMRVHKDVFRRLFRDPVGELGAIAP